MVDVQALMLIIYFHCLQCNPKCPNNSLEKFAFDDFSVSCENWAIYQYVRFLDIYIPIYVSI